MARSCALSIVVWVVALFVGTAPAAAQGIGAREVDLRPKFRAGQQLRYTMEMTNSSRPTQKGQPSLSSKAEFGLSLKTKAVGADGGATVDLVFDRVKISTQTPEEKFEFDSSKPPKGDDDIIGLMLQPLVGSTLTLTVDSAGNISAINGGESFAALGQFVAGGGDATKLFGPLFTVKKGTGMARIGESWENEDSLDNAMLGQFTMKTRHTLRSAVAGEAKVDMSGQIRPRSEAPGTGAGQIKDSSFNGAYLWDTERGALKSMDATMRVRMNTNAAGERSESVNEAVVRVKQVR
jgi:hypothetical protein